MKASILINNYNYGRYLSECIESAIGQTHDDYEIILYDDGSSDNSLSVARTFSSHLQLLERENFGKHPSLNQANAIFQALRASSGDIVCLLDSDDAFFAEKVEQVVAAFNTHPNAVLVQHLFEEIDSKSMRTGTIRPQIREGDPLEIMLSECTLTGLFAQTSALSFRRGYLEEVLPIEEDPYEKIWPDVRLTRQAVFYGGIVTIREPLSMYRLHGHNDSLKLKNLSYLKEVIVQMYGFFNEALAKRGMGKLSATESVEYRNIMAQEARNQMAKRNTFSMRKLKSIFSDQSWFGRHF